MTMSGRTASSTRLSSGHESVKLIGRPTVWMITDTSDSGSSMSVEIPSP